METISPLVTLFAIALFICFLFIMAWVVAEIGKVNLAREKEYDSLYGVINYMIDSLSVTSVDYEKIQKMIDQLKNCRWKNPEKTDVLVANFQRKFGKIRIEKHLKKTA